MLLEINSLSILAGILTIMQSKEMLTVLCAYLLERNLSEVQDNRTFVIECDKQVGPNHECPDEKDRAYVSFI